MRKFVIATLLAGAASGFMLASGPISAAAAETHGNCVQFDTSGNIVPGSVVPNCTETVSVQGGDPQQMSMPNPCTGDPGTVTLYITHQVFHVNVNGAGDIWLTGTQTGAATFTSSDDGPNYSGHATSWFGAELNRQNAVTTGTLNVAMQDGAGDVVSLHQVTHMRFDSSGAIVQAFSNMTLSCG